MFSFIVFLLSPPLQHDAACSALVISAQLHRGTYCFRTARKNDARVLRALGREPFWLSVHVPRPPRVRMWGQQHKLGRDRMPAEPKPGRRCIPRPQDWLCAEIPLCTRHLAPPPAESGYSGEHGSPVLESSIDEGLDEGMEVDPAFLGPHPTLLNLVSAQTQRCRQGRAGVPPPQLPVAPVSSPDALPPPLATRMHSSPASVRAPPPH